MLAILADRREFAEWMCPLACGTKQGLPRACRMHIGPAMASLQTSLRPPAPPAVPQKLRLSRAQWIGLPLIVVIPVLALAGVFGETVAERADRHGPLVARASVPVRIRYRQRMTLELNVENRGNQALTDVQVRIDSSYLDRFSGVSLSPAASPDGAIRLGPVRAREAIRVAVTLEGDRFGVTEATAHVTDAQGDTVRLPLATLVFP